jgi:hypothetical protein
MEIVKVDKLHEGLLEAVDAFLQTQFYMGTDTILNLDFVSMQGNHMILAIPYGVITFG